MLNLIINHDLKSFGGNLNHELRCFDKLWRWQTVFKLFWKHSMLVYVDGGQFKVFKFKISWANFSTPPWVYFINNFSKSWKSFLEADWGALNFPLFKWVARKMYLHDTLTSMKLHFSKRADLVGMSSVLSAAKIFTSFRIDRAFWFLLLKNSFVLMMVIICTIHLLVSSNFYIQARMDNISILNSLSLTAFQTDWPGWKTEMWTFWNLEDWHDVGRVEPIDLTMKFCYDMICLQTILILCFLSFSHTTLSAVMIKLVLIIG